MNALSLFSNVGFGELYFKDVGVNVLIANELLKERCEFYSELHPEVNMICGDITEDHIKEKIYEALPNSCINESDGIDLIIATPPCQGMSKANATKKEEDCRNSLICHAMDVFNDMLPSYMLIENVPDLVNTYIKVDGNAIKIIDYINSRLPYPFKKVYDVLDAKHYNTPQSRKRFIGLISKYGEWVHPAPSEELISVRQAIGHLPSLESGEKSLHPWHYAKKHNERHVLWMKNTPTGKTAFDNKKHYPQKDGRIIKGFRTTYKRMRWDHPAPSVTMCNGAVSSQNNVHPGSKTTNGFYTDARVLSIMELAILCGIPEDYLDKYFNTKYTEGFLRKVLGECFPPTMSREIIKNIKVS